MGSVRLSILGVGLLGGSIGLAAKRSVSHCTVVGYGHRAETLAAAKKKGAIEVSCTSAAEAAADSDVVVLATPVGLFESLLREIAPALKPGAIVTDVGSTKRSVVRLGEEILPAHAHFVGSHPMAGSEKRGVEFATADLFQNAVCILTPTPKTDPAALETVRRLWTSLGMRLIDMTPDDHDRRLAEVSHLPHAVAAAMVLLQDTGSLPVAGKGFLDVTRIAAGDGGLWRDILLDNRDNVQAAIDRLIGHLQQLSGMLKEQQGAELTKWLDAAAQRRTDMRKQ